MPASLHPLTRRAITALLVAGWGEKDIALVLRLSVPTVRRVAGIPAPLPQSPPPRRSPLERPQ